MQEDEQEEEEYTAGALHPTTTSNAPQSHTPHKDNLSQPQWQPPLPLLRPPTQEENKPQPHSSLSPSEVDEDVEDEEEDSVLSKRELRGAAGIATGEDNPTSEEEDGGGGGGGPLSLSPMEVQGYEEEEDEDGPAAAAAAGGGAVGAVGVGGSGGAAAAKTVEVIVPLESLTHKCLFYITAFFVLLAVFSLFAFLFLVPFVIDPAFTTIFMDFDPYPALCTTASSRFLRGSNSCGDVNGSGGWNSCREGCTKETYNCTQIRVHYRRSGGLVQTTTLIPGAPPPPPAHLPASSSHHNSPRSTSSTPSTSSRRGGQSSSKGSGGGGGGGSSSSSSSEGGGWDFTGAKLQPNVKGCGYPPMLNCSIFIGKFGKIGSTFPCYYSKVDPMIVVTSYDMRRVVADLVYSMAIPIPSFILSVVYLIFAYFRIYNQAGTTGAGIGGEGAGGGAAAAATVAAAAKGPLLPPTQSNTTTTTNNNIGKSRGGGAGGVQLIEMNELHDGELPRERNGGMKRLLSSVLSMDLSSLLCRVEGAAILFEETDF